VSCVWTLRVLTSKNMANDTSLLNKKIIKADGREESFVTEKIFKGIFKAAERKTLGEPTKVWQKICLWRLSVFLKANLMANLRSQAC